MNKKGILKPALLIVIVVAVLLVVVATNRWQARILSRVTYPLILVQHHCTTSVDRWRLEKMEKKDLLDLLERTVRERNALRCRVVELESMSCFDRESRELRNFSKRYRLTNAICAQVIQKQFSPEAHYFLINAGELQGIKVDMVAFYEHHLVGRVSEVYPAYSKILLFTDRTSRVAAICTRTGARGIVEGVNDSAKVMLDFVSHFELLNEGDLVTTYGVGLVFPRGLALGEVAQIAPAGVLKKIAVKPLIELQDLSFCLIASAQVIESALGAEPVELAPLAQKIEPCHYEDPALVGADTVATAKDEVVEDAFLGAETEPAVGKIDAPETTEKDVELSPKEGAVPSFEEEASLLPL